VPRRERGGVGLQARAERIASSRVPVVAWVLVVVAGLGALAACVADRGQGYLCGAGSVAIVTAYSWALAAGAGGPWSSASSRWCSVWSWWAATTTRCGPVPPS
jgi:hypothetical protein